LTHKQWSSNLCSRMSSNSRFDPERLAAAFTRVRSLSEAIVAPLQPEDTCIQSMPDVSPTKWHLAHTSWFFETFVLDMPGYTRFRPGYDVLFNSYYQTVGPRHPRPQRGLLSRPTLAEVLEYRHAIDERVLAALPKLAEPARVLVELGLHHEQQHQELILTDILHVLAQNPLFPAYRGSRRAESAASEASPLRFVEHPGGLVDIGRDLDTPEAGFGFDNEGPRHKQWLQPFALAIRPSTCAEYLAFMRDDGYARPELWLSEGWDAVQREAWTAPSYWHAHQPVEREASPHGGRRPSTGGFHGREADPDGAWRVFTLDGLQALDLAAPVCHLSYYEADAFARWSGARLPSEAEWELLASASEVAGNLLPARLEQAALAPTSCNSSSELAQLFGDVWEWTASPYLPYPGYRPPPGAVGEYNGKFMCNQIILRGGSCVTPADHIRPGYRNFFPAAARWQFSGVRLARDPRP
jgi:formylglycine-generating enzyme required for sulfatase activity